jgi:hypothetical protein
MFELLTYLLYVAAGLTIFFGLLPLVVSIAYRGNPPPHIDRILERYLEVSAYGASSIFMPLRSIKRKGPDKIEPPEKQ